MKFIFIAIFAYLFAACGSINTVNPNLSNQMPSKILWAWERPEDLRFLDPKEFGVAFLAQTLTLEKNDVSFKPRRQPLEVSPGTYLIAVTRIDTVKETSKRPTFSSEQTAKLVSLIQKTLDLPDVKAIQIDFDAVVSEREFYRNLMIEIRNSLESGLPSPQFLPNADKDVRVPLTMTSLASWCTSQSWFNDFPVDEAVPMVFVMGADSEKIRNYLRNGNDWQEPLCRGSYGISVDEPKLDGLKPNRRIYYFKNSAWSKSDLANN